MCTKLKHTQPIGWPIKTGDISRKCHSTSMSEEISIPTIVYSSPYIYISSIYCGKRHNVSRNDTFIVTQRFHK